MINDSLGHSVGDKILVAFVQILKRTMPERAFIARFGGDEFAILIEGCSPERAREISEDLRFAVWENNLGLLPNIFNLSISISIGIARLDGAINYSRSLALADMALYRAKEKGRNRVMVAEPTHEPLDRLAEITLLIRLVREALAENSFLLYYQPVFSISNGEIVHYEALIRLKDDGAGVILPEKFIPVAENFGLMQQIDTWVVNSCLTHMAERPDMKVFINISGATLEDKDLLDTIESNIRTSGVSPSRIGFEITETSAVRDLSNVERWIRKLKKLGCLFALDDFGTGFSSFSYLQALPVDFIKLDKTFVQNVDKVPVNRAIIQAIISISSILGKKTIAEYIENEAVYKVIKELGVYGGQGFFLGRPDMLNSTDIGNQDGRARQSSH